MLAQIERARVPRSYFAVFQRAIDNAQVYDFACVSPLGKIDNADLVAEMADFLLRCEDLRWTMVTGIYNKTLYLSLRCAHASPQAHAGKVARIAVGGMGAAGGHGRRAGGRIPLGECDRATRDDVVRIVTDNVLEAVKAKRTLAHTLLQGALPDDADGEPEPKGTTT
jgi:nanoRNase/pAp phosphatase (c-di-AMP/oligoRNAs hydrolase)